MADLEQEAWGVVSPQSGRIIVSSVRSTWWACLLCFWRDHKLSRRGFNAAGYKITRAALIARQEGASDARHEHV